MAKDSREEKEGRRWWERGVEVLGWEMEMDDDREFMALVVCKCSFYSGREAKLISLNMDGL